MISNGSPGQHPVINSHPGNVLPCPVSSREELLRNIANAMTPPRIRRMPTLPIFFCIQLKRFYQSRLNKFIANYQKPRIHGVLVLVQCRPYFKVAVAPASSSFFFISSASSFGTPSLITFGAPSTAALASPRGRPVISRTALIAAIF